MGYGLVNMQRTLEQQAKQGLQHSAQLEQQREATNDRLEEADKAGRMNSTATAAGLGFMVGGPVGAAVGGAAGYVLYDFF